MATDDAREMIAASRDARRKEAAHRYAGLMLANCARLGVDLTWGEMTREQDVLWREVRRQDLAELVADAFLELPDLMPLFGPVTPPLMLDASPAAATSLALVIRRGRK